MGRLEGKVAIITGSNSGVGAYTAELFAKEGAKVVLCARRAQPLEEVAAKIRANGGEVLAIAADISHKEEMTNLVAKAKERFGKLDILINNAAVIDKNLLSMRNYDDDDLDRVLAINVHGTMHITREALSIMEDGGSIVNMASIAGIFGMGGASYVATKGAVVALTKHTAVTNTGRKIRCNAVCPGTIMTPMVMTANPADYDPDSMTALTKHLNLELPPSTPETVANVLLFLASDESVSITGQCIVTDFGASL